MLTACVKTAKTRRCTARKIDAAANLHLAGTATLKRAGKRAATGEARDGLLTLTSKVTLKRGRYTLTVTGLDTRGHQLTRRATVTIS